MKEGVDEQKDLTLSEVENTLVCCLLTSVDAPGLVSTLLHKEMFSDAALGFVFQAVMNLYEQGVQPDMVSVETEMRRMDETRWKELNGLSFLLNGDAECAPWRKCAALCSGDKAPVYVNVAWHSLFVLLKY